MSRSLNKVFLLGNLGQDAEVKTTASGITVATLSLATERRFKDKSGEWKSEPEWHRVVAWKVENLAQYLTKGAKVLVEGRLQTRKYEKDGETRYATEVVSESIVLCGGAGGAQGETGGRGGGRGTPAAPGASYGDHGAGIDDSDTPF